LKKTDIVSGDRGADHTRRAHVTKCVSARPTTNVGSAVELRVCRRLYRIFLRRRFKTAR
jgi:hypothetical protein